MTHSKTLTMPINNVHARGDFTLECCIGSQKTPVQLILDTGSSTLAIDPNAYQPHNDDLLIGTHYAQDVTYGLGGWTGPVVKTYFEISDPLQSIALPNTHLAIATTAQDHAFAEADGIIGLAYHQLNKAFNLESYFDEHKISPSSTFPWTFPTQASRQSISDFKKFLWQFPKHDLQPYFTALETHGLTSNKFAFITHRSSIHHSTPISTTDTLVSDPLNQGLFLLGGGVEHKQYYQGDINEVEVLHDVYYNTHLKGIQIDGCEFIAAPSLEAKDQHLYFTNSIIDTGCSGLLLCHELYQSMLKQFSISYPHCKTIIDSVPPFKGVETGIPKENIQLNDWPPIHFFFQGKNNSSVKLTCHPSDYWQINSPKHQLASFKMLTQQPHWPNQSIIGLPLLNNYYTVFNRAESKDGIIQFAQKSVSI